MPSPEPNKEIDELLKAYAKKRREQAPPQLHAASRKLLQDSVRQTFRPAPSTRRWGWPRLALGGCLAAAMVVIALLVVRRPVEKTEVNQTLTVAPAAADVEERAVAPPKNAGQEFVQIHPHELKAKDAISSENVLSAFQMERQGPNVLVLDSDGSVYKGKLVGFGSKPADDRVNGNYSFEVKGLNKASKKNVIFTGKILEAPPMAVQYAAAPPGSAPEGRAQQSKQSSDQVPQFPRITGKVQVGASEFDIEAQPPPQ
jgi:hypothetical protein